MLSFRYICFTRNTHRAQEITKGLWRRIFKGVKNNGRGRVNLGFGDRGQDRRGSVGRDSNIKEISEISIWKPDTVDKCSGQQLQKSSLCQSLGFLLPANRGVILHEVSPLSLNILTRGELLTAEVQQATKDYRLLPLLLVFLQNLTVG